MTGTPINSSADIPKFEPKTSSDEIIKRIQDLKHEVSNLEKQYNEAEAQYKVKLQQRDSILSQVAQIISQQTNKPVTPEQLTPEVINAYITQVQQAILTEVNQLQESINEYKKTMEQPADIPQTTPTTAQEIQSTQSQTNIDLSFLN